MKMDRKYESVIKEVDEMLEKSNREYKCETQNIDELKREIDNTLREIDRGKNNYEGKKRESHNY
jgi:NAD-dependent SIR2 family protein deacetylase